MNAYKRTMSAIYGERHDRTPVIPLIIQHALSIAGISHRDYSSNGKMMAEAQLYALELYGYDGIHITTDNQIIAEVLGCEIYLPEDEPPQYIKRILGDKADLSLLNKSFDPKRDGRMPVILEASTICRNKLEDNYFIKVNCDSGPFSIAAALRGEENLFTDMFDDEQYVFDLLEICSQAVIRYAKAIADAGAQGITFGDSTSGLVGRSLYEKFALPFQKYVIESLKNTGLPIFMHICGDCNGLLDLMAQSGADVLEIDSMTDLASAYQKNDKKVCFEGNVSTITALLQGTENDVYNEAVKCIEISKGSKLILSSGCEVPRYTPGENIFAMVRASEDKVLENLV